AVAGPRTRRTGIPMGRARRAGIPVRRTGWARVPLGRTVPAIVPAATAAAIEIVGRNPAIGTALFDKAPTAPAVLHINPFAAAQRVDDGIAGAGTGAHIDVVGGVGGGGG